MKIPAARIDHYINNDISNLDSALLYGPDEGLIAERKDNIVKKILGDETDPLLISKFDANELQKDPDKLYSEVNSISLIPGRRVIIINNSTNNFQKIIKEALSLKNTDYFIIVTAKELAPASSLRKNYESGDNIVALPCYIDDIQTLAQIAREELKELNPNSEIISYIAHNLSGNRLMIKQELNKIKIFAQGKSEISFTDIENLLSLTNNVDFQTLSNAVASKKPETSSQLLEELLASGFPNVTIIRVLINYFQRILTVKSNLSENNNFDHAIKSLRPPVFFKQKDILRNHVNIWNITQLKQVLQKLENLEKTIKSHSTINGDNLLKFFLLLLSKK